MFTRLKFHHIYHAGVILLAFILTLQTRWFIRETEAEWQTLSVYAVEVLIWLFFLGARFFLRKLSHQTDTFILRSKLWRRWFLLAGLLAVSVLLSSLVAEDSLLSLQLCGRVLTAGALVWLWLSARSQWRWIFLSLLAAFVFQASLGWLQFIQGEVFGSTWLGMSAQLPEISGVSVVQSEWGRWLRVYGGFPHPNVLGGSLTVMIVIFVVSRKRWSAQLDNAGVRIGYAGLLMLLLLVALLSFSRAALVLGVFWLLSALGFLFSDNSVDAAGRYWSRIMLVGAVAFMAALWPLWQERLPFVGGEAEYVEQLSYEERAGVWSSWRDVGLDSAGFGIGAGNYMNEVSSDEPVHSAWAIASVELGFVGLIFLLLWQLWPWWQLWRSPGLGLLTGSVHWLTAALALILILSLNLDHWWYTLGWGWYWWVTVVFLYWSLVGGEGGH